MKKYFLATAIAILAMAGPWVGAASAQTYFNRGGPTVVDRLVGNGNYVNPAAYGNYNYANRWGHRGCHRRYYGNYNNYNAYNNYGNLGYMGHYHHHHRW